MLLGEGAGMAIYILHCDDCDGNDDIHESYYFECDLLI